MTEKKREGLPEIANKNHYRNPLIIILMVIVLIFVGLLYLFNKTDNKEKKSTQEVYTTQVETSVAPKETAENIFVPETKKVTLVTTPVTAVSPVNPEIMQQQIALIQEKQEALQQRLHAPLMLVNNNQINDKQMLNKNERELSQDANTQFMNQVSKQGVESETASNLAPLNTLIAQGTFIHAILESATNSDLPGFLRAVVRESVYAEDGSQVLIPPGSRLIGQYKSGLLQGQSRIYIVWIRVITPQGISVQLGSSGVDDLGVAGIGADEINRHFWQRFGNAALLSLLGAGAANINSDNQEGPAADYREAIAESFSQSASQSLQQDSMIAPTLETYQGKSIKVFVAKDIHFENVMSSIKPKMNVF